MISPETHKSPLQRNINKLHKISIFSRLKKWIVLILLGRVLHGAVISVKLRHQILPVKQMIMVSEVF